MKAPSLAPAAHSPTSGHSAAVGANSRTSPRPSDLIEAVRRRGFGKTGTRIPSLQHKTLTMT
jgi:hypothetical protein